MCMIRSVLHSMVFQEPHKLCRSHDDFKVGSLDSGSRGLARLELLQDHYNVVFLGKTCYSLSVCLCLVYKFKYCLVYVIAWA